MHKTPLSVDGPNEKTVIAGKVTSHLRGDQKYTTSISHGNFLICEDV
ncbi:MAG: hypothetical protein Q4D62_13015 [Planctomycetia bacterium]|nr:hypothetical protein [Planctomycetia bacterium]